MPQAAEIEKKFQEKTESRDKGAYKKILELEEEIKKRTKGLQEKTQ